MDKLVVRGTEINVQRDLKQDDFLSLTDIAKSRIVIIHGTSSKTGFVTETLSSSSACGKRSTIRILTVSNSMRLEVRRG